MPLSLPNKDKKKKKIDEVEERLSPKKVSDLSFSEARAIREQYGSLKNYELATDKNRAKRIDEQMQDLSARRLVDAATARGTPVEAESYGKNNKWNDYTTVMSERKSDYDRAVEKLKKDLDVYSPIADVSGMKNYLDATKAGYEYPVAFGKAMAERGAQFKNENAYRTEVRNAEAGWGDKYRDTADQSSEGANSRWDIYQENKRRIEELKARRDNLEYKADIPEEYAGVAPGVDPRRKPAATSRPTTTSTETKASKVTKKTKSEYDTLTEEIDRLEAENRQYENTQMPTDRAVRSVVMSRDANAKLLGDLYDVDTIGDVREGDYEKYYNSSPLIRWMVAKEDPNQETYKFDRDWQDEYGLVDSYANYEYLTDEEKSTYFEMLHTAEAKAETEREMGVSEKTIKARYDQAVKDANSYIDELEIPLAARREKEAQEYRENAGTLGNVVGSILSVPLNLVGGAAAFLDDMGNLVQGKKINPYSVYHAPLNFASGERSATSEDIVAGTKNFNILGFNLGDTYQALMSAADSVAGGLLFGRAYTITMGMGASASRARELFENGASNGDIFASALTSGLVEAVTEYVSIDKFLSNFLESSPINKRDIILKVLTQGGIEASEEFAADILNAIQDEAILGTQSEWNKKINELVDGGMSKDEAGRKVFFETIGEALKSAAGGFISGVAMGGGAGVAQGIQLRNDIRNEGNYIIDSEGVEALRNIANEMTGAPKSVSKLVEKTGKKPTAKNVGRLSRAVEQNVAKNADAESRFVQGAKYALAREGVDLSDVKAREGTNLYNNVDVSEKISDTGTTVDTETGGEITIDERNPITQRDGKTYLNTSAGEILQDDIKYSSEKEAQLYEYVSDLPQSVANAIVENYKGQENVRGYVNGMRDGILLYGYNNIENVPKNTAFATLSKADQQYARQIGRNLAAEDLANVKPQTVGQHIAVKETATTSGERVMNLNEIGLKATPAVAKKIGAGGTAGAVYTKGDVDLNSAMGRADGLLAYVYSSIAGNSVVLYDSKTVKDADLKNANGKHVASDGTIYLDIRAEAGKNVTGGIAYTLGHELTHEAEQWAKKEYAAFRKFLYENYIEKGTAVEDLIAKKMSDLDTTDRAYAESEVVADACERMLLDSDAMKKLAELQDKEPGTFKKIVDFIKRALEKIVGKFNSIREVYKTLGAENTRIESKLVQEFGDNLKKLQDMWSDMVVKAAQNRAAAAETKQTTETKEQYSKKLSDDVNARYMELAKDPAKNEAALQRMVEEAARESMPNSKVRSKAGKLIPVYHYTNAEFTEFKEGGESKGSRRTLGDGYYVSTNENEFKSFGKNKLKLFANITHPFKMELTKSQAQEVYDKYFRPYHADKFHTYEPHVVTSLQSSVKVIDYLKEAAETNDTTTSKILLDLGFDGVHSGIEWVAFNSSQLKSADPVTYDSSGNIIPLSERFNENNDDIRYSRKITAEESKRYLDLAKDPQKNETQLREMVRDAATKAGYDSPMLYHGTNAFGFTIPKGYLFATDSEETAGTYSGTKSARNISEQTESNLGMYQLYANADGMLELDANGAETNHIALGDVESDFNNSQATKSWHQFATINQIIKYAKENGYTGVIVKNVVDSATPESRKITSPATDYVFFSPQSQLKSADPVVYDNNGKVIPLEERFNPENDDIRYSRKSAQERWDAGEKLTESQFYNFYSAHKLNLRGLPNIQEQIESIKSEGFKGDAGFGHNLMPTRQNTKYPTIDKYNTMIELEKEGVYEKGYADKWKAEQGEEFGKPVPSNISEAKYGPRKGDYILLVAKPGAEITKNVDRVREGYKPKFDYEIVQADYDYQPYYEMYSKAYDAAHDQYSRKSSESYAVRDIVDRALKRLDPSSAEYRAMAKYKAELDTLDNMRAQLDEAIKSGDRQAQTKLTNNIKTQRGILNRIENSASMKNVASMRDVTRLADDAKKLREMLKLQSIETNGTIAKQRSVNAAASEIMEKYGIKRGKGELNELLSNYYTKMMQSVNNETMTREAALDQAREAAEWIARHVPDEIQYDDGAIEALDMLRGYKVKLNDNQRQNIRAKYDDINGWRRAVGGYITLSNEGKYLDELWPEWAERAPGYFNDEMLSDADMPERLAEIIDSLKKSRETVIEVPGQYEYDLDRAANDVYEAFWNIEPEQTVADKYAERIKTLKAEHNAMMSDLRKSFRDTIREETREAYREGKQKAREYTRKIEVRRKVKKLADRLYNIYDKPKVNKYVPAELAKPTVELLKELNFETGRESKLAEKFGNLKLQYDAMMKGDEGKATYPQEISDLIEKMRTEVKGMAVKDMTADQLEDIYTTLKAFDHVLKTAREARNLSSSIGEDMTIYEAGEKWINEISETKEAKSVINKYTQQMLTPREFFERLASYKKNSISEKVFDMLNRAERKQAEIEMRSNMIFDDIMKNVKYLSQLSSTKNLVDIGLKDSDGNAVPITRGMMLAYYMHTLNEDNARHVAIGGMKAPDLKQYYKGDVDSYSNGKRIPGLVGAELAAQYEKIHDTLEGKRNKDGTRSGGLNEELQDAMDRNNSERVEELLEQRNQLWAERDEIIARGMRMIDQQRQAIEEMLTDEDKAFIKATQDYFENYSKDVLNEATMQMYGFEKARVENYFPIHSDANFLKAAFETVTNDASLENKGFMKDRVKAANPIMLEDFSSVINSQIQKTAQYAAFAPILREFNKLYSVKTGGVAAVDSVMGAIDEKFGQAGTKYISNLVADMNGARRRDTTFLDRARSNFAGAVLTLNPRVSIVQAASYSAAAAVVGHKALAKALVLPDNSVVFKRADQELIAKYTARRWQRNQGGADVTLHDAKSVNSLYSRANRRLRFLTGWIEAVDAGTVGRLWYASEYYVREHFKNLERGTDEYYEKTAEIFDEVVERTQPNYTTLQRPDILRNPNQLVRSLTMFMTQRLQNFNILYSAARRYNKYSSDFKAGKNDVTQADVREARMGLVNAVSSQVVAAATIAGMKLLADALLHNFKRRKDDETGEVTTESLLLSMVDDFTSSLFSDIIGGSEAYDAVKSIITGSRYYGPSIGGVEVLTDMADRVVKVSQKVFDKDKKPSSDDFIKVGYSVAQLLGLPAENAVKIGKGLWQHAQDIKNGEFGSFNAGDAKTEKQKGVAAYRAYERGDMDTYEEISSTMKNPKDAMKYGTGSSYGKFDEAVETGEDLGGVIDEYLDMGYTEEGLAAQITRDFKQKYRNASDKASLKRKLLDAYEELGYDRDKKSKDIDKWLED